MLDSDVPRNLPERTGIHICVRCLKEVRPDEYYQNDYLCGDCALREEGGPPAEAAGSQEVAPPASPEERKSAGEESSG